MSTTLGDFTGLAKNYRLYRAGYSETAKAAILGCLMAAPADLDYVDVGAGTGIWTRQMAAAGFRTVRAVEPNDDMRENGIESSAGSPIQWLKGSAESTGLADHSCDVVSMASSFHWADFDLASREFHRILRPEGHFVALWNPRLIEVNPLLVKIEENLRQLSPEMKRVSSGRSDFTANLTAKLWEHSSWEDVIYLEGRHTELQSTEHYLGLWESVNDIRAQLGEQKFGQFLNFVREQLVGVKQVEATYLTRAWVAKRTPDK